MDNYGDIQSAMAFYGCTRAGVYKRASRGKLPFKEVDGVKYFVIDDSFKNSENRPRKKPQGNSKPIIVKKDKLDSMEEEDYYPPVNIVIPQNNLCDYDFVRHQLSLDMEITPLVDAKIFEYVTVYNNYWNLYHSTHSQPIFVSKVNPMFAVVKDEYTKLKDLERQLGIGFKNKKDLGIEKRVEENPFARFME